MEPLANPVQIMTVAFLAFLVAPFLSARLRLPSLVVLIVLGALVGPAGLGVLARDGAIELLGTVGLLYLLFVAGLELDLNGFTRHRQRSVVFGLLSFVVPLAAALVVAPLFGFGPTATLMVGAIVASHTLLAYPIATRLGLTHDPATTTVLGGSLLTDTLSLALLAIVGAIVIGDVGPFVFVRLFVILALYVAVVLVLLPRVARWFFRGTDAEAPVRYVFLLAAMFVSAAAAQAAGAQPIIGAFLAGLAINRLVPAQSTVMARVRFVGEAFFIPFFLLSVGMLVDVRVLVGGDVLALIAMFVVLVIVGKGAAALIAQRLLGFDRRRGLLMAGLSIPQAAATLAVTFVGLEIGLFDAVVVNAVIGLILVSVVVGATLVQRAGREVALARQSTAVADAAPHRVLVPLANPDTVDRLLDVAFLLREAGSTEAVYPLTVVVDGDAIHAEVAAAERVLGHAVVYAAEADVPVIPLTRAAVNPASGVTAAARERRITDVVIGWHGSAAVQRAVFGSVIDQVIEQSSEQVLVCRLPHPVAMARTCYVVLGAAIDYTPGFHEAVRTIKQIAGQLGTDVVVLVVRGDATRMQRRFDDVPADVAISFETIVSWSAVIEHVRSAMAPDDLVMVVGARRGTVAWAPELERYPRRLAALGSNFVALYPSERTLYTALGAGARLALTADRVVFDASGDELDAALARLVATIVAPGTRAFGEVLRALSRDDVGYSAEVLPDTVLAHARTPALAAPAVAIGLYASGLPHPRASSDVMRVVVLLGPMHEEVGVHLARLSTLVQRLHETPAGIMLESESPDDVVALMAPDGAGSPRGR